MTRAKQLHETQERERPPRLHIPIAVKRVAARYQGGFCTCGCGTPIWADAKETKVISGIQWDHVPALILRDVDWDKFVYVPDQLDPRYIVARCTESHRIKTSGAGATTAGTDIGIHKKERKRAKAKKPSKKLQGRGFRKDLSRGFDGKVRRRG